MGKAIPQLSIGIQNGMEEVSIPNLSTPFRSTIGAQRHPFTASRSIVSRYRWSARGASYTAPPILKRPVVCRPLEHTDPMSRSVNADKPLRSAAITPNSILHRLPI